MKIPALTMVGGGGGAGGAPNGQQSVLQQVVLVEMDFNSIAGPASKTYGGAGGPWTRLIIKWWWLVDTLMVELVVILVERYIVVLDRKLYLTQQKDMNGLSGSGGGGGGMGHTNSYQMEEMVVLVLNSSLSNCICSTAKATGGAISFTMAKPFIPLIIQEL